MSLFSFFNKQHFSNAFSFDHGTLRFISLVRRDGLIHVEHFASEQLLGSLDETDSVIDEAKFVAALRTMATAYGIKEANIVIPDARVVCFHSHVAKQVPRAMGDVIEDHIKTYCESHDLLMLTEYISEYEVILETQFGYDIHVTLVPKKYVEHLVRLFKQAGIAVPHIETAHHAVARSCVNIPTGTGYVAVAMGTNKTTVYIVNGDHLVAHDIVDIGTETIFRTVSKYLQISRTESEKIITRHGLLKTHPDNRLLAQLYQELSPVWQSIDRQLISLGQIPYKIYGHRFITNDVLVYGAGVGIKGLCAYLAEHTNLRVRELDVWAGRTDRAPIQNLPASETPNYAESLSLALLYLK